LSAQHGGRQRQGNGDPGTQAFLGAELFLEQRTGAQFQPPCDAARMGGEVRVSGRKMVRMASTSGRTNFSMNLAWYGVDTTIDYTTFVRTL
jgi:hypothetical protein